MAEYDETPPVPALAALRLRARDQALIEDFNAGLSLPQMAEKHGIGNPRKVTRELDRAMRRLDRRLIDGREVMRVAEYLRLLRMTDALDEKMSDPKAAAELRLQSESRRRLYAVDLQPDIEGQEIIVNVVDMRIPQDRENTDGAGVVEHGEFEEMPRPELEGGAEEPAEG